MGKQMKKNKKEKTKAQKIRGHIIRIDIVIVLLVVSYLMFAFSSIPFIKKWRTIYIETAMTTMTHQWLATMFLPQSVIDEVMDKYYAELAKQNKLESKWEDGDDKPIQPKEKTEEELFFETYWELDTPEFRTYLSAHPELTANGYDHILIEDLDMALELKTSEGDTMCVLNTENKLLIVGIAGSSYVGKLAIIKDPSLVFVNKSKSYGSWGQEIEGFCQSNNAIVGINGSRFRDAGGHGSGGVVVGAMVIDGEDYGIRPKMYGMKFCGMKNDDRFYISNYDPNVVSEYRWGIEGLPALIVDGQNAIDTSMFMGLQPRSCIGQTQSGDFHLLIIDGRKPGYSLGGTIVDCMEILQRYKCYQAMNLDGGSSSVMYYNNQYITKSSSATGRGRYLPDAIMVKRVSN